jgi:hypothetical protein
MSINKALVFGTILVCTNFGAYQALAIEYDDDEQRICNNPQYSFTTVVDRERRVIPYSIVDGQAVVEGDIVLGQEGDVPTNGPGYPPVINPSVNGRPTLWPKAAGASIYIVPFTIDDQLIEEAEFLKDGLPDYIHDAITEWEKATVVRFRSIGNAKDWRRDDYVKFMDDGNGGCSSNSIGVREKHPNNPKEEENVNVINLSLGCREWGIVAHEIGHVLGLFHEQSREDRNRYVKIIWNNIREGKKDKDALSRQYCEALYRGGGTLLNTNYDYDSIMHYSPYGFAKPHCDSPRTEVNGTCPAMVLNQERLKEQEHLLHRPINVGQRDHLSKGDKWVANYLYPPDNSPLPTQQSCVTISTRTTVTDRNGATTSNTTTTTSGNCAPNGHIDKPGKPPEHNIKCAVTCCWQPDRRCCHPGWCPRRRHAIGPWYPPPPPWAYDFWNRYDFDDWVYW